MHNIESVTLEQARAFLHKQEALVFDIREPDEHATGVAAGMRLLPMSQLQWRMADIPKDQTVLLICRTQVRSAKVAGFLRDNGWVDVRYVLDGMQGWAAQGLPLVPPASAVSAASV